MLLFYGINRSLNSWRIHCILIIAGHFNLRMLRGGSTSSLSHFLELYGTASVSPMWFSIMLSLLLTVGSIPTLHLKTFKQLFWITTWRKNSRKAQWQTQSRYLCHCAFLVSFRYAGPKKTWPNHFISTSLAHVTLPTVLRR